MTVTTAIIPAAGWGTRMLPASFSVPKELLPVFDRPSIEWVVAEAIASGIERIVLVSGRGKSGLMDHFDRHAQLEAILQASGKTEQAEAIARRAQAAEFIEVRQGDPRGLGHAVLCGAVGVSGDRVAVLLPDDLYLGSTPALGELIQLSDQAPKKGVIGLLEVPIEQSRKYGMVGGHWSNGSMMIDRLVESRPRRQFLRSPGATCCHRGVRPVAKPRAGALGEIQLTDALQGLAGRHGMMGLIPQAGRFDAGDPEGLLIASLRCALDHGSAQFAARAHAELERSV